MSHMTDTLLDEIYALYDAGLITSETLEKFISSRHDVIEDEVEEIDLDDKEIAADIDELQQLLDEMRD